MKEPDVTMWSLSGKAYRVYYTTNLYRSRMITTMLVSNGRTR